MGGQGRGKEEKKKGRGGEAIALKKPRAVLRGKRKVGGGCLHASSKGGIKRSPLLLTVAGASQEEKKKEKRKGRPPGCGHSLIYSVLRQGRKDDEKLLRTSRLRNSLGVIRRKKGEKEEKGRSQPYPARALLPCSECKARK